MVLYNKTVLHKGWIGFKKKIGFNVTAFSFPENLPTAFAAAKSFVLSPLCLLYLKSKSFTPRKGGKRVREKKEVASRKIKEKAVEPGLMVPNFCFGNNLL